MNMTTRMPVLDLSKYATINQTERNPHSTTDRYAFIPTTRVLDVLHDCGWQPIQVSEARARHDRIGYQKHLVRLRHTDDFDSQDDEVADVLLYNSHSGESSFRLMAGIYRFVCSNGLVVGETAQEHRITHRGYADEHVAKAISSMMRQAPALLDRIQRFKSVDLMPSEQHAFADAAVQLRTGSDAAVVEPRDLLVCRRREDRNANLWTIFNRVQESVINGGFPVRNRVTNKIRRAKRIRSVTESIRLNQGLWNLAESTAQQTTSQGELSWLFN